MRHWHSTPAVLIYDLVDALPFWGNLEHKLFHPSAIPGVYMFDGFGDKFFIPFNHKLPYIVHRKKRGLVASPTTSSSVSDWKRLTKIMGEEKRKFVALYMGNNG